MPMEKFSGTRRQFWLLVAILLALILTGMLFHFDDKVWVDFFRRIPFPIAGALFIVAYIGVTFFVWFAKDLFKIVGAVVFGPYWSTLFIWLAELVNAAIFFHMSRRLGRAYVEEKFHLGNERLDRAGRGRGVWHIFVLRAFPIVPYRILDLAYGLTTVSFRKYLIVTAVAMPAWIFWFQLIFAALGSSVFDLARLTDYLLQNAAVVRLGFLYLIVSTVAVILLRKKI
jgi:uncharacterized membrane protein YdjX (TVP38/TMEM64 family)